MYASSGSVICSCKASLSGKDTTIWTKYKQLTFKSSIVFKSSCTIFRYIGADVTVNSYAGGADMIT